MQLHQASTGRTSSEGMRSESESEGERQKIRCNELMRLLKLILHLSSMLPVSDCLCLCFCQRMSFRLLRSLAVSRIHAHSSSGARVLCVYIHALAVLKNASMTLEHKNLRLSLAISCPVICCCCCCCCYCCCCWLVSFTAAINAA